MHREVKESHSYCQWRFQREGHGDMAPPLALGPKKGAHFVIRVLPTLHFQLEVLAQRDSIQL